MTAHPERFHGFIAPQGRGLIALPPSLRRRLLLDRPGAQVEVIEREDGIVELRAHVAVPASQDWFWAPEWQRREAEADDDLAAGRYVTYEDADEMLASLGTGE